MIKRYEKLWGSEEWITNNSLYCGKILTINKGRMCSIHYHKLKDETFYVLEGTVAFMKNNKVFSLSEGETVHIPVETPHCFGCLFKKRAKIIEVSTQHFEEDSYRVTKSGGFFDGTTLEDFENSLKKGLRNNK